MRWGNVDYKQLQKLRDNLQKLQDMDLDKFCEDVSKELAARLLARHNVGSLPVCGSGGQLQGMVTDRDIVLRCVAAEEDPRSVPVRSIMSRRPAVVTPEDDVRQAARLMSSQQVRRLPVVDKDRVVGVVSLGDLAKCGRYEMEISRALTDISENIRQP